ncbi:Ribonuclease PH [Slackia heliotrinireducens]|uniref:Ribonuclease PH n=1 Tax=Slackia heliotrinireducens (strain ATCC 29202 / DSM 20476 / NCTC 11029 / RHS 1) TaxID=471855 RepID=C7N4X1_SLAHD|nr:ribonuclease PH [Slackia heliotrinireducens]ACV21956.1 RNAse PH [Slackia heliotrinireducens DSM 20476]VEG99810.1 Ribonuclease PH [Slackia heliotrinireducens]
MFATRVDNRADRAIRPVTLERGVMKNATGSCLVKFGDTHVLCAATIEERVPGWRKNSGLGWVTAEYAMLPASTSKRTPREYKGRKGRSQEIERLIGRSLRNVCDMGAMGGEVLMTVDCDVLQADGGTRTASITGAWVAAYDAFEMWRKSGKCKRNPLFGQVAAISVGMVGGRLLLDLDYREDSKAEIDMNVVMNAKGEFIEIQGTGEQAPFGKATLDDMLSMAQSGIEELLALQRAAVQL